MVLLWLEQALQLDSLYWNLGSAPAVTLGLLDGSRPVCSSVKKKKRSNNHPYLRDVVFVSIKRVHEQKHLE